MIICMTDYKELGNLETGIYEEVVKKEPKLINEIKERNLTRT